MDKLFLVGYPLSHSLSPEIYNTFFKSKGINAVYSTYEILPDKFSDKIKSFFSIDSLKGFNITQPYKISIISYLSMLSNDAKGLDSVNCVVKKGKFFYGYNTDKVGFVHSLKSLSNKIDGKNALLIGAGGVAPAILKGLVEIGAKRIFIANRTSQKAEILAEKFSPHTDAISLEEIGKVAPQCTIIVNATTVGLHGEKSVVPQNAIHSGQILYDLIYNPAETDFLKIGKLKGAITINGFSMLKNQAEENLKLWGYLK